MTHTSEPIQVAFVGNPNSGKSTIFNFLTGSRQHVGNYPGVTVERYEGQCTWQGRKIRIIDLPGTYNLTAFSEEEGVTQSFLLSEKPGVVVNIIDASNLERNLYLTLLLAEIDVPMVLVFNMMDIARQRGYRFDMEKLSAFFGAPIVEAVGSRGEGMEAILTQAVRVADEKRKPADMPGIRYCEKLESVLHELAAAIFQGVHSGDTGAVDTVLRRWTAIKLLEKDPAMLQRWNSPEMAERVADAENHLRETTGQEPEVAIASARYETIKRLCAEAVEMSVPDSQTASDKLDEIFTHRYWGIPIFLLMMYLLFQLTFTLGAYPVQWIESGQEWLSGAIIEAWGPSGETSLLRSLIVDGIPINCMTVWPRS